MKPNTTKTVEDFVTEPATYTITCRTKNNEPETVTLDVSSGVGTKRVHAEISEEGRLSVFVTTVE